MGKNRKLVLKPLLSVRTNISLSTSSRRSSTVKAPDKPLAEQPSEDRHRRRDEELMSKNHQVVKFVYSEAVERAFRRRYRCTTFGPMSAAVGLPKEPGVEVTRLPEIYSDFQRITDLLRHNKDYSDKLREELGETYDGSEERTSKMTRNAIKNAFSLTKIRQQRTRARTSSFNSPTSSVPKLPPLVASSERQSTSSTIIQIG